MLSPSKPPQAAGEEVQCAPSSSLDEMVAHAGWPSARKLTVNTRPVRGSTVRYGSRLVIGPGGVGDTSCHLVKSPEERTTTGAGGAPLIEPGRSAQPWKNRCPSGAKPRLGSIERAPVS